MLEIPGQALDMFAGVHRDIRALLKVSLVWAALTVGLLLQSGSFGALPGGGESVEPMIWQTLSMLALFVGWYAGHRYMIAPEAGARLLPAGVAVGRFVGAQLKVLTGLTFAALTLVSPLIAAVGFDQYAHLDLTQPLDTSALQMPWQVNAGFYAVVFLLFARFMLVAPLAARDLPKPVRRSWTATRGHWLRLCVLQAVAMLPAVAVIWFVQMLDKPEQPYFMHIWLTLLNVVGEFYSLWLLMRLAEDEFAQLYDPTLYSTEKAAE